MDGMKGTYCMTSEATIRSKHELLNGGLEAEPRQANIFFGLKYFSNWIDFNMLKDISIETIRLYRFCKSIQKSPEPEPTSSMFSNRPLMNENNAA